MSGTERKPNRREFLKRYIFNLVVIGAGVEGIKGITAEELQKQTNLQLDQAERIVNDALHTPLELKNTMKQLKLLSPPLLFAFIRPVKKPLFAPSVFTMLRRV